MEKSLAFSERNPLEADQSVRDAKHLAGEALQDIRRSVSALRSTDQPFSIVERLTNVQKHSRATGVTVSLDRPRKARPGPLGLPQRPAAGSVFRKPSSLRTGSSLRKVNKRGCFSLPL